MGNIKALDRTKLIEHLTMEIQILTSNMMTFRTRAAFTVWIGPFIILGSIIIAMNGEFHIVGGIYSITGAVIVIAGLLYLALGWAAGGIEKNAWEQCDNWRKCITGLAGEEYSDSNDLYKQMKFVNLTKNIRVAYCKVFALILATFICVGLYRYSCREVG